MLQKMLVSIQVFEFVFYEVFEWSYECVELAIEEAMGDDLKLFLGEVMIDVDEDQAAKYQEKFTEEKKMEMDELEENMDEIESGMKELKTYLYAKFGSAINLEQE